MLKFHLLGHPHITHDDQPVTDFASEKEMLLFCYLACHPGEHSRSQLAGLLWSEMSEERARANLSTAIYNLRQLCPAALDVTRKTVALNPEQPVWLDTTFLQNAIPGDSATQAEAIAHYRGLFLEGIYPPDAPELDAWLQQERERWRLVALTVLEQLSHGQTRAGQWDEAIATLRRLLDLEPWREESHRLLMRLLASQGQFNAALVQYETCQSLLLTELGVEPMVQTTAVYERIRAARQRTAHDQLPSYPTPLVGRVVEMGTLFTWLHDPKQRLISLVGPGGSGKTRLAVAAAARQAFAFRDGVCFVPLAEVDNEASLVQTLAAALSLTLSAGTEKSQLFDYLRGKEMLLVLDNVEQALEPVADFVAALLEMAPRLCLLVTSREYLQLRSENRLPLDGLPFPPAEPVVPSPDNLANCDAMQLLVQEARRVKPDFRLNEHEAAAATLCRLVEGLPLALELAAALLDSQTLEQLLAQIEKGFDGLTTTMRDVPSRHRGLRAVFDYSWTRLSPQQQAALSRLALFHGGFTGPAAAAVAEADAALLTALVAQSLVRREAEGRYSLHAVIRQYALERLENKELVANQYAAYFAGQVEQATAALYGPQQTTVVRQLLADAANIEASWQITVAAGKVDRLSSMAPGLTRFYQVTGLFQAGAAAFHNALSGLLAPPPALPIYHALFLLEQHEYAAAKAAVAAALAAGLTDSGLLAQAHLITAAVHLQHGNPEAGRETIAQALAAAAAAQTPWLEAQAWRRLGEWAERAGDYDQAETTLSRALTLYEASGDPLGLAQTYQALGIVHFRRGDMPGARELLEKALVVRRQVDATGLSSARVLVSLGSVVGNLGQAEEARRYFRESLAVFQQTGDRSGAALALDMLGEAAAYHYDFTEAQAYLEQALALRQEIGQRKGIADARRHLADLALRLGKYDEAASILTDVLQIYRAIQDRRGLGTTLARLALVHSCQGHHETAEQEARTALAVADELGNPLLQAYGLSSLAHALRGQAQWEQAAVVYGDAIRLWQQWDAPGLKAQMQAALASVHYANGQRDAAWPLLEAALSCLVDNPQPDCDALGELYLDCILLLEAKGKVEQAAHLQQQAVVTLHRQAVGITPEQSRATFLTGIKAHQRLFALDLPRNR